MNSVLAKVCPIAHEIEHDGPIDEVAAVLAFHEGDATAAIKTLLGDCRHLREQLALSQIGTSTGFTRGWRPSFE